MKSGSVDEFFEPGRDCALCPRLRDFALQNRKNFPEFHNGPVPDAAPADGGSKAALLIVGLAPGLKGANRTGIPFTGDHAGDMLMERLRRFGFIVNDSEGGSRLINCLITNAVRCVPPQNKPVPSEITTCRSFLDQRIKTMTSLKVILAIGRTAHESVLRTLNQPLKDHPFKHGGSHNLGEWTLISSYHCSRYNFNTGVLNAEMLDAVFETILTKLPAQAG